ncbi:hypothetical protein TrST_g13747 [Triparma strigata]|uniref:Uncharacterized protein n=1 Tax=Triparma strigata TaxID=1606541 RepID=A0A9W7ER27_9STRA|nr:hypothetical protein TrST_g13747 [Triparma strigata]
MATEALEDIDKSNVADPFFVFGHNAFSQRETVWAVSDHSFIHPAGAKVAIHSQAKGGDAKFLPGLDAWSEVSCCSMSHDKTHFAICVKGYNPSEETLRNPPPSSGAASTSKNKNQQRKSNVSLASGVTDDGMVFDAAVIVYKLPFMEHGDPNPEKKADIKKPEIQGNTAIVEANVEVEVPKRVRTILHKVDQHDDSVSEHFCSCSFSHDGKMLFVQTKFPDYTLRVYDWFRNKLLASLSLEIEATKITTPLDTEKMRICTSGPDHLCFWQVGAGARELKALDQVNRLELCLDGDSVTDHAWLFDMDRVVCTSSGGKVVIVSEKEVVQIFRNTHSEEPISCVLAFEEGVTGAATTGDDDDVAGFLTMGVGGLFCLYHHCKEGDNTIYRTPYTLSQRFRLESSVPGPPIKSGNNHFMDVQSLSLGPDIGDACLLFISTPSGIITIDVGQLEAETDQGSFVVGKAGRVEKDEGSLEGSLTSNSQTLATRASIFTQTAKAPPKQDDVETMCDVTPYQNYTTVSTRHAGSISSISVCARKPLLATCSSDLTDSSVRIWNYRARECVLHEYFEGLQNPNSVSVHPSGNELIVGFDDNVKVYHLCSEVMKQASQIQVKQMIHVFKMDEDGFVQDKLVMNQDSVSMVKYSPDGGMFAVVTGKFVQIFGTYGSQVTGQPQRINVLSGHAQAITNLQWTGDSLGLHTCDAGGAIYEWTASKPDRIRETLLGRVNISAVGSCLNGGCLAATGGGLREKQKEALLKKQRLGLTGVTVGKDGKVAMFNPQARQAIQKNRKRSLMLKKQQSVLNKSLSIARMSLLGKGGQEVESFTMKDKTAAVGKKEEDGAPKSQLFGWAKDLESSSRVSYDFDGRVCEIICTMNNDLERDKNNYAFVCTSTGNIVTFEWANVTGYKAGELNVDEEDDDAKFDENGVLIVKKKKAKHIVKKQCRDLALHVGEIKTGAISACQNWLFTIGEDGCVIMSALTRNAARTLRPEQSPLNTLDEELALADANIVSEARERVAEVEEKRRVEKEHLNFKLVSLEGEKDKAVRELKDEKNAAVTELKAEILDLKQRIGYDKGKAATDLLSLEKSHENATIKLEGKYEKRNANDTTKWMELKNAYDDLMVAATDDRSNMDEYHSQEVAKMKERYEKEIATVLAEQKTLQEYAKYVKDRYDEILENNDVFHDNEIAAVQQDGKDNEATLKKKLMTSQGETSMMQRQNKVLRDTLETRNIKNYELKEVIEGEKKKVELMKVEVGKLAKELDLESERANKWEVAAGQGRRQVVELEKVRKVLTHQLHELRGMLEPKESKIVGMKEKLKDLESEYEKVMTHATTLEKDAGGKGKRIGTLSETIRKQRNLVGDKDNALHTVVTQVNLRLQELQESGDWKNLILNLKKVIAPYLTDSKAEKIRNGLEDAAEQRQQQVKLRRLLEAKVGKLEKKLQEGETSDAESIKLKSDNVELMEQLNEMRKVVKKQNSDIIKLKNNLRQKEGQDAVGQLKAAGSFGPGMETNSLKNSLMKLDNMLYSSVESKGVKAANVSGSRSFELLPGANNGVQKTSQRLSKASKNIEAARATERLLFLEQQNDNLLYAKDLQNRAIELLSNSLEERGVDTRALLNVLGNLNLNVK